MPEKNGIESYEAAVAAFEDIREAVAQGDPKPGDDPAKVFDQTMRWRLEGMVKAVDEELQPGSREFVLAGLDEMVTFVASLRSQLADVLARAEAAEALLAQAKGTLREIHFRSHDLRGCHKGDVAIAELALARLEQGDKDA